MKKLLAIILVFVMITSVAVVSVSAQMPPVTIGDADDDWKVTINDATEIQRYLAQYIEFDRFREYAANVDNDDKVSILDATYIQRYLAQLIEDDRINTMVSYDMMIHDFYADYDSGVAMVGVPVTFTVNAFNSMDEERYELYVDDVLVESSDSESSLSYTFDKPGSYNIMMLIVSPLFSTEAFIYNYEVVDAYDSSALQIKSVYSTGKYWGDYVFYKDDMTIHVEAMGGTPDYEYKFVLISDNHYYIDEEKLVIITQDYSADNTFVLPEVDYNDAVHDFKLEIFVKDANGDEVTAIEYIPVSHRKVG